MIPLFIGMFIFLFGVAVVANAAFSDRAQLGFWISIVGASIAVAGVFDLMFGTL